MKFWTVKIIYKVKKIEMEIDLVEETNYKAPNRLTSDFNELMSKSKFNKI